MLRRVSLIGAVIGGGLAALAALFLWLGLTYVAAHATGSRPDRLTADVIVPLAGSPDRNAYARMLWSRGVAPAVWSTLVDQRCLRRSGPGPACATGVRHTVDEAVMLRRFFEEEGVTRAIVVTSRYHVARAAAIFAIVFAGTGIDIQFLATPDAGAASRSIVKEAASYLPSLGAAVLARVAPAAYDWSMERLEPSRCPHQTAAAGFPP